MHVALNWRLLVYRLCAATTDTHKRHRGGTHINTQTGLGCFSYIKCCFDICTAFMVIPKSPVGPFTKQGTLLPDCSAQKNNPQARLRKQHPLRNTASDTRRRQLQTCGTADVHHMSTRWPHGHQSRSHRRRRGQTIFIPEHLPWFLLLSTPLLMLAVWKRSTSAHMLISLISACCLLNSDSTNHMKWKHVMVFYLHLNKTWSWWQPGHQSDYTMTPRWWWWWRWWLLRIIKIQILMRFHKRYQTSKSWLL